MKHSEKLYLSIASGLLIAAVIFNIGFADNASITGNTIAEHATSLGASDESIQSEQFPQITLPVKIHLVRDSSGFYTTARDGHNIGETFREVNRIWEQAGIHFEIEEIVTTDLAPEAITTALNGNAFFIYTADGFDNRKINVFFTQSLNNINGIAIPNINAAIIADFTTVHDYRTTAHELGHLLGLRHLPHPDHLLAQGKNGELLSEEYITLSRKNAQEMLAHNFYFDETSVTLSEIQKDGDFFEAEFTITTTDNNENADANGGKLTVTNADIITVQEIDWELQCEDKTSFSYECIFFDTETLQWFNEVNDDSDSFTFTVRFPTDEISTLSLIETGGMECGAYYQSALHGPYTGYEDGSGGLDCSARVTTVLENTVSENGGFPHNIPLQNLIN